MLKPEQVVDPASYYFHKAVAEHAMGQKLEAGSSIARLLDDVTDAPERYQTVAALMIFDMLTWRDKDLAEIARKMDNIDRRLQEARGGNKTQEIEKDVIARLDEIIKKIENKQKSDCSNSGDPNGGGCPESGQQQGQPGSSNQPSSPMQDSMPANNSGPGNVDPKRLKELDEVWGTLPPRERAKAMVELTRNMDPQHREMIENYFKRIQNTDPIRP